jgi:phosphate-selective porin OprO/OprP
MPALLSAQIVDPQNVLLRNVHIVQGAEAESPKLVSILIRNNVLELVSPDEIPKQDGLTAVDGRNGFLLGNLVVGQTPSFLILNQDPTVDFSVLLDTDFYTIFAIHDGELRRNNLFAVDESDDRERTVNEGWKSYTPPPMALPSSYLDTTKWNRWEGKYVSGIFLAAGVLDRINWLSQNGDSEQQVGDLRLSEGGEVRGFRIGAVGTLNFEKPWVYTIFGATNAFDKGFELERQDSFALFDYRLDIPLFEKMNLSIGKQKEPISHERVQSMIQNPMQERSSVSDAFMPSRNVGIVLSGTALEQRMTWAGGIFNDWFDTDTSIGDSATQLVGRVTWLPYISEDESNLVHLGLGLRYSNGKEDVQFRTEPEFNKSPIFVDTDEIPTDHLNQVNLEVGWRRGPYWIGAEYVSSDVDSPAFGDLGFSGYHFFGSWVMTGELRNYNRKSGIVTNIPVARSVYQGGKGTWELTTRWSSLDLTDGAVDGGEMDIFSLGVNWWLSPIFNVNMNYRYIQNDRSGFSGTSSGFVTRILLVLE